MEKGKSYILNGIPIELWDRFRHAAITEGLSIKGLILKLIQEYLDR
jgi:hypothetical protein